MRVRACVRVCGGCMWEGAYVHACVCVSVDSIICLSKFDYLSLALTSK